MLISPDLIFDLSICHLSPAGRAVVIATSAMNIFSGLIIRRNPGASAKTATSYSGTSSSGMSTAVRHHPRDTKTHGYANLLVEFYKYCK